LQPFHGQIYHATSPKHRHRVSTQGQLHVYQMSLIADRGKKRWYREWISPMRWRWRRRRRRCCSSHHRSLHWCDWQNHCRFDNWHRLRMIVASVASSQIYCSLLRSPLAVLAPSPKSLLFLQPSSPDDCCFFAKQI